MDTATHTHTSWPTKFNPMDVASASAHSSDKSTHLSVSSTPTDGVHPDSPSPFGVAHQGSPSPFTLAGVYFSIDKLIMIILIF
jgi:hypothetical protein